MNKKEKLIASLGAAITALKTDTVHYQWNNQESCNCGVVSQAILGKTASEVHSLWSALSDDLDVLNERRKVNKQSKLDLTWQNAVKNLCPVTGEPMHEAFKQLFAAGLSKTDIVHLEYLDNPAILERSGIDMKIRKEVKSTQSFFSKLFNKNPEPKYEIVNDSKYFGRKENLILYLTAWRQILMEGSKYKDESADLLNASSNTLESELLNALADEKYEYAAELRDQLNSKK